VLAQDNNLTINNNNIYIKNNRNVGIDVGTSPSYKLDVGGDINCTGNFRVGGNILTGISATQAGYLNVAVLGTAEASKCLITSANIDINGLRYIGTSGRTATYPIDCNGDLRVGIDNVAAGSANCIRFAGSSGDSGVNMHVIAERIYGGTEQSELYLFSGNDNASTAGPDRIRLRGANIVLQTYNAVETFDTMNDNNTRLIITATGNVGISTTPSYLLDVGGDISLSGTLRNGATALMNSSGLLQVAGQTNITSLGTLTGLSINGNFNQTTQSSFNQACIWTNGSAPTNVSGLTIFHTGASSTSFINAYNYVGTAQLNLNLNNGTIYCKTDKTVGINNTSPSKTLDITGTLGVSSDACVSGKLRVGSATNADFPIHCTQAANDRILALYNTSTAVDFYGFGANSASVLYHSSSAHRWYLGSTGTTTGTKYMDLNATSLTLPTTTSSTSTTTGALIVAGGIGCNDQVACIKLGTTTVETTNLYLGGYQAVVDGQELSKVRTTADGVAYANKCLITDANIDIGSIRYVKAQKLMAGNSFSDTGRMITAYDSTVVATNTRYLLVGGQANSTNNAFELSYYHVGNGGNNEVRFGRNGGWMYKMKFDGVFANPSIDLIDASGNWVGPVNTSAGIIANGSNRLRSNCPDGVQIYNSDYNDTEFRLFCGSYNAYCGTWGNGALRLITGGTTQIYIGGIGSNGISFFGSSTSYPFSLEASWGLSTSTYHYWNSSGANGTGNNTGTTVSCYMQGRLLCTGEIDVISDRRVKTDIANIHSKFVDRFINDVCPKAFKYRQETDMSYGYVAQDCIKAGLSRFVQMHKNEDMEEEVDEDGFVSPEGMEFSINSAYFIPLLHMKVKQLSKDNDNLNLLSKILIEDNKSLKIEIDRLTVEMANERLLIDNINRRLDAILIPNHYENNSSYIEHDSFYEL
jgi:hypothetical protein